MDSGLTRRDVLKASGALALGLGTAGAANGASPQPEAANAATPQPTPVHAVDVDALVHPELRPQLEQFRSMSTTFPALTDASLPEMRRGMDKWIQPALKDVPFEERAIPGLAGQPDVKVVIVNARSGTTRPAILHTHGGGYVLGAARGDVRPLQETAKALDCICVSVDYRLAPETRWQGSTVDNYAGLKWLYDHARELGADRTRIAVMGESAGGGHAALLALMARDRGEVPLVLQVLVYPMLDDRTGTSRPVPAHIGSLLWTAASNRYGWQSFLGLEPGGSAVPTQAVPARVADLSGLPPTWIGVGSIDLFVDEDIEYARRLVLAGVRTELEVVPGAFHGFDMDATATSVAKQFSATKLNALRRAFGMPAVV
jgi:acetyl esterase/lipase